MGKRGKSKYENYFKINEVVGGWNVVDNKVVMDGEAKILCICGCGYETLISAHRLSTNTSVKYGCYECSTIAKTGNGNPNWKGTGKIPGAMIYRIKNQAEKRNIEFDVDTVSLDNLFLKQNGRCKLTKEKISFHDNTASLDRIDSNQGYVIENLQWVHKDVNIMKNKFSQDRFIEVCRLIVENV